MVVEDSQDTPVSPTLVAKDTPPIPAKNIGDIMYIPIVYGDRDTFNSFVVSYVALEGFFGF